MADQSMAHPRTAPLVPPGGEVFLDHVGLFVPDFDASPKRLEELGFHLTPFVAHMSSSEPKAPASSSGTGNQCAMFESGYLEMLGPTVDTPLSRELRAQLARYPGLHLIAFAADQPERNHARVAREGFEPLPLVRLARPVATETGQETARFSVIRVPPHIMPEGRIQIVTHHTPDLVWQARYQRQPNATVGLSGALLCVDDARSAARRFGRFVDAGPEEGATGWVLRLGRGRIHFVEPPEFRTMQPDSPLPCTPYIAEAGLETRSLEETRSFFDTRRIPYVQLPDGSLRLAARDALGASFVFHEGPNPPW